MATVKSGIEIMDYQLDNPNYAIDKDAVYKKHETAQNADLKEVDETFGKMMGSVDGLYQQQIDEINRSKEEQINQQNERTDFAIQQIEQQKEKAQKDYTKEQSGAYVDWQKQSNQYGVNAEKMAGSGLTNTGYSESSQVSMYNTYQNRIAVAREIFNQSIINYNNAIKDAQLQNSSVLAEIAMNAAKESARLALECAQYNNDLLLELSNRRTEIKKMHNDNYLAELDQLYKENALAEEVRQYNKGQEMQYMEYKLAAQKAQEEIERAKAQDLADNEYRNAQLTEEKRQFDILHPADGGDNDVIIKPDGTEPGTDTSELGNLIKESTTSKSTGGGAISGAVAGIMNGLPTVENDTDNSNLIVDTASLVQLGLGPLTAEELEDLIKRGYVQEYVKGNTIKYRFAGTLADRNMLMALKQKKTDTTTTNNTTTTSTPKYKAIPRDGGSGNIRANAVR